MDTPQGQSDTGRNPRPLLASEPSQEHDTKSPFSFQNKTACRLNPHIELTTLTPLVCWKEMTKQINFPTFAEQKQI